MLYYYSAGILGLTYDKLTETARITSKASALHHPHHITVAVPLLLCHLTQLFSVVILWRRRGVFVSPFQLCFLTHTLL
jgi:hypothetical protein